MARLLATIVLVAALGASGAAIYSHLQHDGLSTFIHRLGFKQSGRAAAEDELLAAGSKLQSDRETYRTYRQTDLSHLDGLQVGYVTDRSYCVQVTKAGRWYHMTGPDGVPLDGSC